MKFTANDGGHKNITEPQWDPPNPLFLPLPPMNNDRFKREVNCRHSYLSCFLEVRRLCHLLNETFALVLSFVWNLDYLTKCWNALLRMILNCYFQSYMCNSNAMDPDKNVNDLNKSLSSFEEIATACMGNYKFRYLNILALFTKMELVITCHLTFVSFVFRKLG